MRSGGEKLIGQKIIGVVDQGDFLCGDVEFAYIGRLENKQNIQCVAIFRFFYREILFRLRFGSCGGCSLFRLRSYYRGYFRFVSP